METVIRVILVLVYLGVGIWWIADFYISTFGPHSLFELWHIEAKYFSLSYGWFVFFRIGIFIAFLVIGAVFRKS
jgi:hypothetical protein